VKELATAPIHWKRAQWLRFGEGLALVGATMALDKPILDAVQRNRTHGTDQYFKNVTHLGGGVGQDVAIALLLGGIVSRNQRLRDTGFDALESSIWAAGVVTPLIKSAAGRARPVQEQGTYHFDPYSGSHSFPSGHATNAFALATAIAAHSDGYVVPTIAYTLASSVAIARVNDRVHFPSDVVAGALIGRAVAKSLTARHRALRHVMIVPTRDGVAFSVTINLAPRPFSPRRGEKVADGRMRGAPHPRFADPLPAAAGRGGSTDESSPQQRPTSFATPE
jgi:membrane-associated phospholipid phosphatase